MSHHEDKRDEMLSDEQFDDYLKRGPKLSQQYKRKTSDEVPPELDQKILLQARDAVSDKKIVTHPSWWTKWNKPLAFAATLMLAVTVIYRVGDRSIDKLASPEAAMARNENAADKASTSSLADNASVTEEKLAIAGQVSSPEKAEQERKRNEPAPAPVPQDIPMPAVKQPLPATPSQVSFEAPVAASAAPAAPSAMAQEVEKDKAATSGALAKLTEKPKQDTVVDSITANDIGKFADTDVAESLQRIPGASVASRAAPAAEAKKEKRAANPEELLQHIRDLRKQGKDKEALKAWKQFRKAFPDYPVAEDDVARMN